MHRYSLAHLSDDALLQSLVSTVSQDRGTTANLLAHLAEVEVRKLYLAPGHASMHAYCVHELHMSEESASRRLQAARKARRFPFIFAAVADGRLHLTAVNLLAPHLVESSANELLRAAVHKTKAEIEQMLATRFPRPDLPTAIEMLTQTASVPDRPSPAMTQGRGFEADGPSLAGDGGRAECADRSSLAKINLHVPEPVGPPEPRPRVTPLSAERYALQVTLGKAAREDLQRAQDLLGSEVAPGDIAEVLGRALRLLVSQLEKRKCAATAKPRPARRPKPGSRHVPASVRRAVWERDGGRCAFVGNGGHRCTATRGLEYDHVEPVARGGTASVDGIRLLCRAHNQFEAERTYGAAFMDHKRRGPREIAARRSTAASPRG